MRDGEKQAEREGLEAAAYILYIIEVCLVDTHFVVVVERQKERKGIMNS